MCRPSDYRGCHATKGAGRQNDGVSTATIDDSTSVPEQRSPRAVKRLRRSMAGLAVAALVVTACGSGDDTVSSDDAAESQSVESVEEPADATASDAESEEIESEEIEVAPAALQQNGPIVVTGAALAPFDDPTLDPAVGAVAPVVEGESFDGTPITIGGPTENATFVVFLAHWCPHCNDEVPVLVDLQESGRIPEGLDVIGVSTAVASDRDNYPPSDWIDDKGWPWPTMADDEALGAINAMGGTSFPFAVVLDADGNVLARKAGSSSGDDIVAFLEAALANA